MNDAIEQRVIGTIARRTGVDAAIIVPATTLAALGIAAFEGLEITFEIEDSFDINVPLGACDLTVDTVGDMCRAVREALTLAVTIRGTSRHPLSGCMVSSLWDLGPLSKVEWRR